MQNIPVLCPGVRISDPGGGLIMVKELVVPDYQLWPCQSIGKIGEFCVARPGWPPIFLEGQYHWPKIKAESIASSLNRKESC